MKTRIIVLAVLVLMSTSFADQKPCKEIFKKDKIEKGSRCIQWSFNPPNATNLIIRAMSWSNEMRWKLYIDGTAEMVPGEVDDDYSAYLDCENLKYPNVKCSIYSYQNGEENEFEQVLNGRDVATFALYFQWADEADVDYLFKGRMPWIPWF